MRTFIISLAVLVALTGLYVLRRPSQWEVKRDVVTPAAPSAVFAIISNPDAGAALRLDGEQSRATLTSMQVPTTATWMVSAATPERTYETTVEARVEEHPQGSLVTLTASGVNTTGDKLRMLVMAIDRLVGPQLNASLEHIGVAALALGAADAGSPDVDAGQGEGAGP